MENISKKEIIRDCKRLLDTILNSHPNQNYIEVNIACVPKSDKKIAGNIYRKTPIYIYSIPETFHRLHADGVLEKLSVDSIEQHSLEEVLTNALIAEEDLVNGIYYDQKPQGFYKVKVNKNIALSWLNSHNFYSENPEKYFGFNEKVFALQIIDGEVIPVDFTPKRRETLNTYYLFYAFVETLKKKWKRENEWIWAIITRQEIRELLKPSVGEVNNDWIRFTKGNVLKKIPDQYDNLIKIEDYNAKVGGYKFSLKISF